MTRHLVVLVVAALALVFFAAISVRNATRLPTRFAAMRDRKTLRLLHRTLVVHIAMTGAAACAVVVCTETGWRAMTGFLIAAALARILGDRARLAGAGSSKVISLLLAPVDGLALLISWALSSLFANGTEQVDPAPPSGSPAEAYEQVLELTQKTVERVMVPRSEVAWLPARATIPEILDTVRRRPHTLYPVFEGDFEQLVGMITLVDLAAPRTAGGRAGDFVHPAVVVPETVLCDDLIVRMRREGFEAAIVVDEFGGMAGLVTLQDLLELLVGDLVSEHEAAPPRFLRLDDGSIQVDGTTRIDELEHILGIRLPEGEYETIAGLYLQRAARIPVPGEWMEVDGVRIEVIGADDRRIKALRISLSDAVVGKGGGRSP
jgi:Mg2+/Co2+ transporter CorC